MKSAHDFPHWRLLLAVILMLDSATLAGAPAIAQTGTVASSATASNAAPSVGEQIVVTINIDMSGVNAPDNKLGSFTGTLAWDPAVLNYHSNSGSLAGFTGVVNATNVATGHITFNGANATGATGNIIVLTVTFTAVGAGTSALDLGYSVMAATGTFVSLLPILAVTDGQVAVGSVQPTPVQTVAPAPSHTATATEALAGTDTPVASRTPTTTEVPTLTNTPVTPSPVLTPSASPTAVPTAVPTVIPAPTRRYRTYLSLLFRQGEQKHLPLLGVLDWRCVTNPGECCDQSRVVPRLSPRLAPFCKR